MREYGEVHVHIEQDRHEIGLKTPYSINTEGLFELFVDYDSYRMILTLSCPYKNDTFIVPLAWQPIPIEVY